MSADDGLEDDVGYAIIEGGFTMLGWSVVEVCLPGRNRRSYAIIQYNFNYYHRIPLHPFRAFN